MNVVTLQEVQVQDNKLAEWIEQHNEQLRQSQDCPNICLPLSISGSQHYLLYKLRKIRCEECYKDNSYKFIRIVQRDQDNLGFHICYQCYFKSGETQMSIKKYVPMTRIVSQYLHQLERYDQNDQMHFFDQIHCVLSLQHQIRKKLKQMIASIQQPINQLGQTLVKEFEILVQLGSKENYRKYFEPMFEEKECTCKDNCCHCHYTLSKGTAGNCELHDLKQKQDQIFKNLKLLSIEQMLKQNDLPDMLMCIYKEFESKLIKHSLAIQIQINRMKASMSQISLFNLSEIRQKYRNEPQFQEQQRVLSRKQQCQREGIVNHLTHFQKLKYPPQTQQLHLNYCAPQNIYIFKENTNHLHNLSKITISDSGLAQILMEDLISIHSKDKEMAFLTPKLLKNLKEVSFNCKTSKNLDFVQILKAYGISFRKFDLYGNFYKYFESFNQAFHFLEDQTIIGLSSPSAEEINLLAQNGLNNNILVELCGGEDQDNKKGQNARASLKLIQKSVEVIQGIMFGHPNGITRSVSSKFYEPLMKARNLKAIYLNHINIEEKPFSKLLGNLLNLQALYLNSCSNLSKNGSRAIMKLTKLKKLSLVQVSLLDYEPLPSLQTLIIEGDLTSQLNQFGLKRLTQKSKLTCLNLYNCRQLNQSLLIEILQSQLAKGADLRSINFGSTKITNKTLTLIAKFKNLRRLHIGGTNINLHQLMYDLERGELENLKNIERLSLKGMREIQKKLQKQQISEDYIYSYYNVIFAGILKHFCLLSHLDISCNKVIDNRAVQKGLKYLVYLTVKDTKYVKKNQLLKFSHKEKSNCPNAKSAASSSQITEGIPSSARSQDQHGNKRYLKQISANAT